jgi:hypothetical protein
MSTPPDPAPVRQDPYIGLITGPVLVVATRRGLPPDHRFVLRAETGTSVAWTLRGSVPAGALRTGDLIRVVPGPRSRARAVEVLAGPDGPVLRRLTAGRLTAPARVAGLALAVFLMALLAAVLHGTF